MLTSILFSKDKIYKSVACLYIIPPPSVLHPLFTHHHHIPLIALKPASTTSNTLASTATKAPAKPTEGVNAFKRSAALVDGEKKRGRKFERKPTLHTFTKSLSKSIQILVSPTRPWLSSIFEQIAY